MRTVRKKFQERKFGSLVFVWTVNDRTPMIFNARNFKEGKLKLLEQKSIYKKHFLRGLVVKLKGIEIEEKFVRTGGKR